MRGMPFTERLRTLPWLAGTAFARVGKHVFPRADLAVQRATYGRRPLSGVVTEIQGRRVNATARLLEDRERTDAWKLLPRVWPHFDIYAPRATERELLVFRLTER